MEIIFWILTIIFGLGIVFVRKIETNIAFGYVLFAVCIISFILAEHMQLRRYLDPDWTGAAVAVSVLLLIWISYRIKK